MIRGSAHHGAVSRAPKTGVFFRSFRYRPGHFARLHPGIPAPSAFHPRLE